MSKRPLRVAIIGNLAGVAFEPLTALRNRGVEADLFLMVSELGSLSDLEGQKSIKPECIKIYGTRNPSSTPIGKIRDRLAAYYRHVATTIQLLRYDILHVHTGIINTLLLPRLIYVVMRKRKYLAFATGSDIREVARYDTGRDGRMMRLFFKNARKTFLLNADMVGFKNEIGLPAAEFFPFMIDEDKYSPSKGIKKPKQYEEKLLCFMMSHFDWGATDCSPARTLKNNDRFFYALSEFVKIDQNIHAVVLDRGSDKEVAKNLVKKLQIEQYVTFHPPMTELERIQYLNFADVVLDQFQVGAFGLGALESLSMGKPLITYIHPECFEECYGGEMPFLNARTSEEILRRLLQVRDNNLRNELSSRARQWILKHHSRSVVCEKLITTYNELINEDGR